MQSPIHLIPDATTRVVYVYIYLLLWLVWSQFCLLCQACMVRCVTKAMPIYFINGKKLKSCRAGLTNHTGSTYVFHTISHHWLLIASRVDKNTYTHTYTYRHTNKYNFDNKSCASAMGRRLTGLKIPHLL